MIDLRLNAQDLSLIRFARSPLEEAVHSLAALQDPRRRGLHLPWWNVMARRVRTLDLDLLLALTGTPGVLPDFLCPPPGRADPVFAHELSAVRAATPGELRAGVDELRGHGPVPPTLRPLYDDPGSTLPRLVDQLDAYWRCAVEPVWPRLRSLLDADIAYRARRLTTGGLAAVLEDLHEDLEYGADRIRVRKPVSYERPATGHGVLLVPTIFGWPRLGVLYDEGARPAIGYPARGIAGVWTTVPTTEGAPVEELVGRTRARILARLDLPLSTTRVASLLGMTPPTANHHLSVLRRCRLVTSERAGREVLYQRTHLGTSLLDPA
ncbi:DUF5937 family protein [Streptomyces sp. NPDC001941]|uniref:ArsR/SmtB family transcription factor n=1 Tax=Streptomyces sp. NPDC001941 TaxID=3154659 RepID=UPI0033210446